MASTSPYVCPLCTSPSSTLKLYVSHLRVMHSKDPSFNILCGIGDCREVFRTFSAFNSHVYRHHRSDLGMTPDAPIISLPQTYDLGGPSLLSGPEEMMESEEQHIESQEEADTLLSPVPLPHASSEHSHHASEFGRTVMAAKMLLQLREGCQVSQVAISEIVSSCRSICSRALDSLKHDIVTALKACEPEREVDLSLVLNKDYDVFQKIDTNYRFEKFCVEHLDCLVSIIHV